MDYYRPHRTLVVLRWRQYGAAREKQVFWGSCCVFTWGEWAIATHGRYESYILLILFTHICYIHSMTFFVFSTIYFESKTLQNTISYQITLSNNSIRLEHILLTPTSSLYTSSTFYLTLSLSAHLFHTVFQ